jgi:phospholipid/cholesterol/gamma-HCH transport system permease protein
MRREVRQRRSGVPVQASVQHYFDDRQRMLLRPIGGWVIDQARELDKRLRELAAAARERKTRQIVIDLAELGALDTAGAFLLARLEYEFTSTDGGTVAWHGADKHSLALLERVRDVIAVEMDHKPPANTMLEDIGETVLSVLEDARRLLRVLGGTVRELGSVIVRPWTFRAAAVGRQIEMTGVRAVPIIFLMSFLIGGIVAQQGAFQLQFFGATIFTVDLVGILSLREVAPLLTAIMVAGRSGSAITAELGSMRMREEIDALRVMGLDPVNVLVLPRVMALIIVLPLLSFIAGVATLFGAMLTLWFYVDIPPVSFLQRLQDSIDFSTFFSGLLKAPFMALIIGLIACTEGMAVRGSAESLGRHTTAAVVKAIFMVIVVDGIFAIFYAAIDF